MKKALVCKPFIVPLVVYPIVSLIGHAIIEALTRKENHAYAKIVKYLDEKYSIEKGKYFLNGSDLNYIDNIFKHYKLSSGYLPQAIEKALRNNNEEAFTFGFKRSQATSFFLN
ncbi:MAG: hypothetical protein HWD61_08225 [Parachlamydiaceae bacterium]|nr:MAG: hypothetical protein HWD61_08225 [Parachlamydiaceae bacterium]